MATPLRCIQFLITCFSLVALAVASRAETPRRSLLVADPASPRLLAGELATEAIGSFRLVNSSTSEVVVLSARTSCGCSTVELPSLPRQALRIAPGASVEAKMHVDLRHKFGAFTKSVFLETDQGLVEIRVEVEREKSAHSAEEMQRIINQRLAQADRQAVFRDDCARCHMPAATTLDGKSLFQTSCAICHESPNRASAVPALVFGTVEGRPADYWERWTRQGRAGTMMPAFAKSEGGPLSEDQIAALLTYLRSRK